MAVGNGCFLNLFPDLSKNEEQETAIVRPRCLCVLVVDERQGDRNECPAQAFLFDHFDAGDDVLHIVHTCDKVIHIWSFFVGGDHVLG